MEIISLKKKYYSGQFKKNLYIRRMHKKHQVLFDYSLFIKNTDIGKIEITDDQVIITSRQNQVQMICDRYDERIAPIEILNFNTYEKDYFIFFLELVKETEAVFDVGANIGWYSLNAAKLNPQIKVYAFEPIPKTFNYLKTNIKLNNLTNVFPYKLGLADSNRFENFYYYKEGSGNASIKNLSKRVNQDKQRCKLVTIDDFCKKNNLKVDLIKCDVEGAEFLVFKGAIDTLQKDKPIIFSEMLRKWSKAFKYYPNQIIDFFSKLDFNCYRVVNKKLKRMKKITERTFETNFIFLHNKKHRLVINKFL